MPVPSPSHDRPTGLSGGADVWDDGLAGLLLTSDFMQPAPADSVYLGASWAKRYAGARPDAQLYLGQGLLRAP